MPSLLAWLAGGIAESGGRVWPETDNYFNQTDPRWASTKLGFSDSSTICNYGCGVTSIAMVFKRYGIDTDPIRLNADLRRVGAFWDDLLVWNNVGNASQGRLSVTKHFGGNWGDINAKLDAGTPVIVYIDRGSINGPGLRFSDYYSTDAVYEYVTFSPR